MIQVGESDGSDELKKSADEKLAEEALDDEDLNDATPAGLEAKCGECCADTRACRRTGKGSANRWRTCWRFCRRKSMIQVGESDESDELKKSADEKLAEEALDDEDLNDEDFDDATPAGLEAKCGECCADTRACRRTGKGSANRWRTCWRFCRRK